MALTATEPSIRLDPGLLDLEACEVIARPLTTEAAIERALRWSALLAEYPPPVGLNPTSRKVWAALLDTQGPLTSRELALMLNRHRGNIDRALIPLRQAGLVSTGHALHYPVPQNCRR